MENRILMKKRRRPPATGFADYMPDALVEAAQQRGIALDEPAARRVLGAVVGRGEPDLSRVRGLTRLVRQQLEEAFAVPTIEVVDRRESPRDGFVKYLFRLHDGSQVEAVRIPIPCEPPDTEEGRAMRARVPGVWKGSRRRYIVCVSSQVGCALGCSFCATATLGFSRNLTASEIVAQVLAIRATADRPVGGVVFMGMGEPMLNYENVIQAANVLSHPAGGAIAARDITISTAGIVPAIRRFTAEGHRFRLTVSLSSARPERRRVLMPIERKYSTPELVAAIGDYAEATGGRVTVAYVMLGGPEGNTSVEDAQALGTLLRDVPVRLDLIDVNGDVGGHRPPNAEELDAFRSALNSALAQPIARRYSGGGDVDAACGMLAARRPESASSSSSNAAN